MSLRKYAGIALLVLVLAVFSQPSQAQMPQDDVVYHLYFPAIDLDENGETVETHYVATYFEDGTWESHEIEFEHTPLLQFSNSALFPVWGADGNTLYFTLLGEEDKATPAQYSNSIIPYDLSQHEFGSPIQVFEPAAAISAFEAIRISSISPDMRYAFGTFAVEFFPGQFLVNLQTGEVISLTEQLDCPVFFQMWRDGQVLLSDIPGIDDEKLCEAGHFFTVDLQSGKVVQQFTDLGEYDCCVGFGDEISLSDTRVIFGGQRVDNIALLDFSREIVHFLDSDILGARLAVSEDQRYAAVRGYW